MSAQKKSIEHINRKIAAGEATVLTEAELLEILQGGETLTADELDVVTVAFRSGLSGSAAMLLVPVAGRGVFTRAKRIWLNGVEGFSGPAPNERLGVVDTLIFTEQPSRDPSAFYTGADIIVDLLDDKDIEVECLAEEGDTYYNSFKMSELQFARMYTYNSFIPSAKTNVSQAGNGGNEHWGSIHIGDKMMLNKAEGIIVGSGTRSSEENRSLSFAADLFTMDSKMLANDEYGDGYSLDNTIAIPIPILNDAMIQSITGCILKESQADNAEHPHQYEREISDLLKENILAKRFKLTDSVVLLGD